MTLPLVYGGMFALMGVTDGIRTRTDARWTRLLCRLVYGDTVEVLRLARSCPEGAGFTDQLGIFTVNTSVG